MDAVKFVHERLRMCNSYTPHDSEDIVCSPDCEIHKLMKRARRDSCEEVIYNHTEEVVDIVERWSDDHPKPTRQSKFLKLYPFASLYTDEELGGVNILAICPLAVDSRLSYNCAERSCAMCKPRYWLTEEPE